MNYENAYIALSNKNKCLQAELDAANEKLRKHAWIIHLVEKGLITEADNRVALAERDAKDAKITQLNETNAALMDEITRQHGVINGTLDTLEADIEREKDAALAEVVRLRAALQVERHYWMHTDRKENWSVDWTTVDEHVQRLADALSDGETDGG